MPTRSTSKRTPKKSEWQLRHEYAWLREPGLADEELPTPAWHRPLEGRSANDILYQHADPLRALHEGRVPAVVLRSHMDPSDAAGLVRQLQSDFARQKRQAPPTMGKGDATDRWKKRGDTLHMLGADMHYSLKRPLKFPTATKHAEYAQHYRKIGEDLGVMAAVRALHGGLRSIAAGRRVATAVDPKSNLTFSHGVFRMHHPGNVFPIHIDSLWSGFWNQRSCGTGGWNSRNETRRKLAAATDGNRIAAFAADAMRFRYQFSALLLLQRSTLKPATDVTLFDPHVEELVSDCEISGVSHTVGVHVHGFEKSRRKRQSRAYNLTLNAGGEDPNGASNPRMTKAASRSAPCSLLIACHLTRL